MIFYFVYYFKKKCYLFLDRKKNQKTNHIQQIVNILKELVNITRIYPHLRCQIIIKKKIYNKNDYDQCDANDAVTIVYNTDLFDSFDDDQYIDFEFLSEKE